MFAPTLDCPHPPFLTFYYQFLIPAAQTYSLTDTIPFHLQLCAPVRSLRELLCNHSNSSTSDFHEKRIIRVFLARHILIEVNGKQSWRNTSVGEGKLWPVAPNHTAEHAQPSDDAEVTVDWEGEVRCRDDVKTGSFNVGSLVVKVSAEPDLMSCVEIDSGEQDFIVLSLTPTNARTCPFIALHHAHPIRLVTDSWAADDSLHPQDR